MNQVNIIGYSYEWIPRLHEENDIDKELLEKNKKKNYLKK